MKAGQFWILEYCRPSGWTVDLTPPQGDWDYEVEQGSHGALVLEKAILNAEMQNAWIEMGGTISSFFDQIGQNLGIAWNVVSDHFKPVAERMSEALIPAAKIMEDLVAQAEADHEEYLRKNGIHKVKSIIPEINLPIRTFNSGPPLKGRSHPLGKKS